jgi:integrase/recombinase XerD
VRWLQDVRRYQPSTVSRRLSVVVGFYRVCIIDAVLPHSPADNVRRPVVPAESPTLGLGHLQFEALITTARLSTNPTDFALVALLGLLGLRIFEECGANLSDLGEEHGHRVLRVRGKGGKVVLVPHWPFAAHALFMDELRDARGGYSDGSRFGADRRQREGHLSAVVGHRDGLARRGMPDYAEVAPAVLIICYGPPSAGSGPHRPGSRGMAGRRADR